MTTTLTAPTIVASGVPHKTTQKQQKIIELLPLLRETVRVLIEAHDDAHEAIKVMSVLRHRKVEAQACYVHVHAHSPNFFSSTHLIMIESHVRSPQPENAGHIAHILDERSVAPSSSLDPEEYLQWARGLILAGSRAQFLKLMEPGFPGRPIVASIHEQIIEFLGATKHLDHYLLN